MSKMKHIIFSDLLILFIDSMMNLILQLHVSKYYHCFSPLNVLSIIRIFARSQDLIPSETLHLSEIKYAVLLHIILIFPTFIGHPSQYFMVYQLLHSII